jgi:octaprenyl-diphosphate synthase
MESFMHQLLAVPAAPALAPPDFYRPIGRDLEEVERVLARALESPRAGVTPLLSHLAHYRGKRLRPTLLLLAARACGEVRPAHHVLAAVVEMIHTATLVHDDVLDGASVRRHVVTVNAGWGNQASVLLGDYLFTHAFHLSSTLGDVRACRVIGEATNRVCSGEMQQVCERGNLGLSEEDYFAIIDAKTAELTACCCRLGALFADAGPEVVEGLARYGRHLGIAFQIADDLLDLMGEERATGKSLGTDLEQQKLTLPLIHLLAESGPETAGRLRQVLRGPARERRAALSPYLADGEALAYARRRAEEHAQRARAELTCLAPSECRHILDSLPERVVFRSA